MQVEQKDGYTIIDRRGGEPCRVCCAPECHTRDYGKPTMGCIEYLRGQNQQMRERYTELACAVWTCPTEEFECDHAATIAEAEKDAAVGAGTWRTVTCETCGHAATVEGCPACLAAEVADLRQQLAESGELLKDAQALCVNASRELERMEVSDKGVEENGFTDTPKELWRLYSQRKCPNGKSQRLSQWFASEAAAHAEAYRACEEGSEVISLDGVILKDKWTVGKSALR